MDYTRPFAPPHRTSETLSSRLERVRILRTVQRIVKRNRPPVYALKHAIGEVSLEGRLVKALITLNQNSPLKSYVDWLTL